MKVKIIETGSDSRTQLLKGVKKLSEAVTVTLGPNGRNVVIAQEGGAHPQSTKDGVTVAKNIVLKDPIENLGAQMVRQASIKTGDNAGDDTTTSTLLAKELIEEGMNHLSQKHNAVSIKKVSYLSVVSKEEDYTLTGFIESYKNIVKQLTSKFKI